MQSTEQRLQSYLSDINRRYPHAWKTVDIFRASRGQEGFEWPEWCFLPMSASYAIVSGGYDIQPGDTQKVSDVSKLSALAAWRYTQGVYRFDPDVYEAVGSTTIKKDIPADVLLRLPEWGVYIETPQTLYHGFFAHLEHDSHDGTIELRILLDTDEDGLIPLILHVGDWTVAEGIDMAMNVNAQSVGMTKETLYEEVDTVAKWQSMHIQHCLSLLLYLCSDEPDIERVENELPHRPKPKKTKKGLRLFPPKKPKVWDIGQHVAEQLAQLPPEPTGETRDSPRAHIRRAHWHGYWTGKKGTSERKFIYHWLPPMVINAAEI